MRMSEPLSLSKRQKRTTRRRRVYREWERVNAGGERSAARSQRSQLMEESEDGKEEEDKKRSVLRADKM